MRIRSVVAMAVVAAALGGVRGPHAGPIEVGAGVRVFGADARHVHLARWAVGRFEAAGLPVPRVDIDFAPDPSACRDGLGWASHGTVELCAGVLVNLMTRRIILHEMGHIWLDQHVTEQVRARFDALRGLSSWNSTAAPWDLRGYEQGAEILSWELGDRVIEPMIPDNGPVAVDAAYELLTGRPPPAT